MEKRDNFNTHVVLIVIVVALSIGLFLRIRNQDINFSRRGFAGLIKGRQTVQRMIDWPNFKAVGADVGRTYSVLPDDKERENYRKAFIEKFSLGFRQVKGSTRAFRNWRIYDNAPEAIIVAADYKDKDNKTILFTISRYGRRKLSAIQWEQDDEKK